MKKVTIALEKKQGEAFSTWLHIKGKTFDVVVADLFKPSKNSDVICLRLYPPVSQATFPVELLYNDGGLQDSLTATGRGKKIQVFQMTPETAEELLQALEHEGITIMN